MTIHDISTKKCTSNESSLNKQTKNDLLALNHFRFKQRIAHKAKLMNVELYLIPEHDTTKMCFNCSRTNITSNRNYNCKHCGWKDHRDVNSCKNMLKKFIST